MSSAPEKSIHELREESERNRETLAATVGELRERVGDTATELKTLVSPAHIKREVRKYVRQERETLVQSLQRKAKENPLQLAAIGAAVAYPAFGLLRAVPTPLWLIGAGLFLTSERGRQTARDVTGKVESVVQQSTEKVADLATSVQSDLQDRIAGARYGLEDAQHAVMSTVGAVTDKARMAFHDARDAATGATQNAAAQAKAAVDGVGPTAARTAETVKDNAADMVKNSRTAVTDFVNSNALLVAGIGAVVGALIAASIPPSDAENKLFGAGSEKLKEKTRAMAADGIEKAGSIAADAAGAAAAAAAREGLDASGVQGALNKVADSVRAMADKGLETALGNTGAQSTPQQQPISEGNRT